MFTADPNKSNTFNSYPIRSSENVRNNKNDTELPFKSRFVFSISSHHRRCCMCLLDVGIRMYTYIVVSDLFRCDSGWNPCIKRNLHEKYALLSGIFDFVFPRESSTTHTHSLTIIIIMMIGMRAAVAVEHFSGKSTSSFYAFYLLDRHWNPMWHLINMYVNVFSLWCGWEQESRSAAIYSAMAAISSSLLFFAFFCVLDCRSNRHKSQRRERARAKSMKCALRVLNVYIAAHQFAFIHCVAAFVRWSLFSLVPFRGRSGIHSVCKQQQQQKRKKKKNVIPEMKRKESIKVSPHIKPIRNEVAWKRSHAIRMDSNAIRSAYLLIVRLNERTRKEGEKKSESRTWSGWSDIQFMLAQIRVHSRLKMNFWFFFLLPLFLRASNAMPTLLGSKRIASFDVQEDRPQATARDQYWQEVFTWAAQKPKVNEKWIRIRSASSGQNRRRYESRKWILTFLAIACGPLL